MKGAFLLTGAQPGPIRPSKAADARLDSIAASRLVRIPLSGFKPADGWTGSRNIYGNQNRSPEAGGGGAKDGLWMV